MVPGILIDCAEEATITVLFSSFSHFIKEVEGKKYESIIFSFKKRGIFPSENLLNIYNKYVQLSLKQNYLLLWNYNSSVVYYISEEYKYIFPGPCWSFSETTGDEKFLDFLQIFSPFQVFTLIVPMLRDVVCRYLLYSCNKMWPFPSTSLPKSNLPCKKFFNFYTHFPVTGVSVSVTFLWLCPRRCLEGDSNYQYHQIRASNTQQTFVNDG